MLELSTILFSGIRFARNRSRLYALAIGLGTSILLATGVARAMDTPYGMVDPVDDAHAVGYQLYIQECATCHVAFPPAVLPTQTWYNLLTDTAHYGVSRPIISPFEQRLLLNYVQAYSRPQRSRRSLPYRLSDAAPFLALHPNVALPQPLNTRSCQRCHLEATEQNYTGAVVPGVLEEAMPIQ